MTATWASGFAGVLLLVFVAAKLLYSYCLAKLNYGTYVMYTNRLLADYINMPPMRFLSFDRSKMVNCIVLEVARFGNVATDLLALGTIIVTALFFFAGAAMMSLPLLGISFSVGVSMLLINRYGYRKARRIGKRRVSAVNKMLARTYDLLEGFRTIKLEGAEAVIVKDSAGRIRKEQRWRFDNKWNMLSVNNLAQCFTYLVLFYLGCNNPTNAPGQFSGPVWRTGSATPGFSPLATAPHENSTPGSKHRPGRGRYNPGRRLPFAWRPSGSGLDRPGRWNNIFYRRPARRHSS
ncbi:MAG: ABC transporter ATP-binding protein [Proteobacteria bacterium]|nr:ABC transporter ATP-binding protein [Pseudomonadota bacterium]